MFSEAAAGHGCDVRVRRGEEEVTAKSVLSVLTLDCRKGDAITISTDGDGARAALDELVELVAARLGAAEGS